MTPKEKAKELVDKFTSLDNDIFCSVNHPYSKQCALIAVNEILKSGIEIDYYFDKSIGYYLSYLEYYAEVKQEIKKR